MYDAEKIAFTVAHVYVVRLFIGFTRARKLA